jgi:hypothetical protein
MYRPVKLVLLISGRQKPTHAAGGCCHGFAYCSHSRKLLESAKIARLGFLHRAGVLKRVAGNRQGAARPLIADDFVIRDFD